MSPLDLSLLFVFVFLHTYKSTAFKHVHKGGVDTAPVEQPKLYVVWLAVSDAQTI